MALTPLLLMLSLSAATIPAALAVRPAGSTGGGAAIAKVCDAGTGSIKECVETLNANPDGEPPRRLAELAYAYLVKDGEALYKETQAAVAATRDNAAVKNCAAAMEQSMKYYYESVSRFASEESKEKFDQAKNNLDDLLKFPSDTGTWTCDLPVRPKVGYYEDMQQTTLGLMKSADAPPPEKKKEAAA